MLLQRTLVRLKISQFGLLNLSFNASSPDSYSQEGEITVGLREGHSRKLYITEAAVTSLERLPRILQAYYRRHALRHGF